MERYGKGGERGDTSYLHFDGSRQPSPIVEQTSQTPLSHNTMKNLCFKCPPFLHIIFPNQPFPNQSFFFLQKRNITTFTFSTKRAQIAKAKVGGRIKSRGSQECQECSTKTFVSAISPPTH